MGRAEGTSDNGMMSAGEIAAHLLRCCSSLDQFDAYMFGSTLGGIGEDVDLLFVGPDGETLSQLKRELRVAGEFLPLHVVYSSRPKSNTPTLSRDKSAYRLGRLRPPHLILLRVPKSGLVQLNQLTPVRWARQLQLTI